MEINVINRITSIWGIETSNTKVLSDRATLIVSNDGEKFILKKKGSLELVESELKLLKHLRDNNFLSQQPIKNNLEDYFFTEKSGTYCLYDFLEGEPFSAVDSLQNHKTPYLLGETIGTLNKLMKEIDFQHYFPEKDLYQMVYGFAVKQINEVDACEQLRTIYQELEEDIKQVVHQLPKQLIHRDAHIHNLIFQNSKLSGVIDFEIAEVNVSTFDACYCCTSILSEVFGDEKWRRRWIEFVGELVASYNRFNPLSAGEFRSIWYVMLCIQTIFMSFFSRNPSIYETNKAMFLWIYENREKIEGQFQKVKG